MLPIVSMKGVNTLPPRKQFTEDQIIQAAFEVARTEGISGLTARKVAKQLGSSVAPIYANFSDIEELKQKVADHLFELGRRMAQQPYTGDRFLDIGIASLRFAKEYSVLFRELVLNRNNYMDHYDAKLGGHIVEAMALDPELKGFSRDELMGILLKMRIFQLGLSAMIANGLLPPDFDDNAAIELLASAGEDVLIAAQHRKQNEDK